MFGFIVWELWRFVRHALSARGRRYVYIVLPVSVLLFAGGVGFCCVVTPAAFGFLIRFNVELGVEAQFILSSYLRFFMRLLLVFGLAFQTPLVLWFLVRSAPPPGIGRPRADAAPGASALLLWGASPRPRCPRLLRFRGGGDIGAELRGADFRIFHPNPAPPLRLRRPAGGPLPPPPGGPEIDSATAMPGPPTDIPRRQYFAGPPIRRIRRWRDNQLSVRWISIRRDARPPGAPGWPVPRRGGAAPPHI